MNPPTRSSARLHKQRKSSLPTQSKQTPRSRSSTLATNHSNSAKRRRIAHTSEEPRSKVMDSRITETPTDVLYEIFSYLEPLDLLHLSWSSKALHSVVMAKSARFIWEKAFGALNVPPPPCPPDLNLAQYTRFLFDKQCIECNSLDDTYVLWSLRSCICRSCLEGKRFSPLMDRQYRALLPCAFIPGKHRPYARTSELNEVKAALDSLEPGSSGWEEYVKQREERATAMQMGEQGLLHWWKGQSQALKETRQNMIVQKLNELGWKDELDRLSVNELQALPGMGGTKPLTDKVWKTLCPPLIARLEANKNSRLEQERQIRITERCHTLSTKISSWAIKQSSPENMLPRVLDVALNEPFKSFIFNDSDTEPTFLTDEDELERMMEQFTEEWNDARVQYLLSLIPTSASADGEKTDVKGKGKATPSALNLAMTIFHCPSGGMACPPGLDSTSYPRILVHECQRPTATKKNCRDTDPEGLEILSNGLYSKPWLFPFSQLTFDQHASNIARAVVRACGEDPDEITAERMDEIDCRLQCTRYQGHEHERYILNWRKAIWHELTHSPRYSSFVSSSSEANWRLITDPKDLALVYAAEKAAKTGALEFACKLCHVRFQNTGAESELEIMQAHWKACFRRYSIPYMRDLDDRLALSHLNLPLPEEKILRTMFEFRKEWLVKPLDGPIPPRKEVNEDDKTE